MRIKTDCHFISGTATEIVTKLGKFVIANGKTIEEYMAMALQRIGSTEKLNGQNPEERCRQFLQELEQKRFIQIVRPASK